MCQAVDSDPWGIPYKIVMKKLSRRSPIPGIQLPGKLQNIVTTLFPANDSETNVVFPHPETTLEERQYFSPDEIKTAALDLPTGRSQGPDNIFNEVIKKAAREHPEVLQQVFNKCINEEYFPAR